MRLRPSPSSSHRIKLAVTPDRHLQLATPEACTRLRSASVKPAQHQIEVFSKARRDGARGEEMLRAVTGRSSCWNVLNRTKRLRHVDVRMYVGRQRTGADLIRRLGSAM